MVLNITAALLIPVLGIQNRTIFLYNGILQIEGQKKKKEDVNEQLDILTNHKITVNSQEEVALKNANMVLR